MTAHLGSIDQARLTRTSFSPITTEHGLALFDAVLPQHQSALLLSPVSARALARQARDNTLAPILSALTTSRPRAQAASAEGLQAQLATQTAEQQLHTLTTMVANATATVLTHPNPDALDTEHTFKDLGIDSLTALELRNTLTTHTGLTLPATLVFDHPTPTALAKHLTTQLTTTTPALGPIGQLLDAAFHNDEHTTLIDILIAASNQLIVTDLTARDDAPARLVCLSEFHGQYQTLATGIQENIQVTEIITPGFSGTLLPTTAEHAAQAIIDALEEILPTNQTIVFTGHGITCIPALHAVKLLRQQVRLAGTALPNLAIVFIAPIAIPHTRTISADPLLSQAISAHLHNETNLIAYGRYLRFGLQPSEVSEQEERLLTIHPRTGNHIKTPLSPLVLEPARTALIISNWIDELQ
jgi:acyl carrier protein